MAFYTHDIVNMTVMLINQGTSQMGAVGAASDDDLTNEKFNSCKAQHMTDIELVCNYLLKHPSTIEQLLYKTR